MNETSDIDKILKGNYTKNNITLKKNNKIKKENDLNYLKEIISLIKENDDFDSNLALIITLIKLIDNYEKKDIIPKNMSKAYALLSKTNDVQKDLINAIIEKGNNRKGQTKKMDLNIIYKLLESLKNNEKQEKESLLQKIGLRR